MKIQPILSVLYVDFVIITDRAEYKFCEELRDEAKTLGAQSLDTMSKRIQ